MGTFTERVELKIGAAQYRVAQRAIRGMAGLQRKQVEVDGLRIPYLRGGKGAPLLLLHGFGDRKETFAPLALLLARHFELLIPDLPGFGAAPRVDSDQVSANAQSRFVARFLAALGVTRAHIVGQSMGGAIAARFADDHAGVPRSLTLLAAAGPRGLSDRFNARLAAGANPLLVRNLRDFEALLDIGFARPLLYPRAMRRFLAQQWAARGNELIGHFERMVNPPVGEEIASTYSRIDCPAQVIYGTAEQLVHAANIRAYRDGIPGAQLHMLNGVGHNPHHEATFKVARLIRQFRAI